ncbi:MAG: DUF2586 family protein, partial [Candidatus Alcyoniella australis]|nr:DUF2586 family protein [Candidatus Alcyoniella australis]
MVWGGVEEHKTAGDLTGQITDVTGSLLAVGPCESGETSLLYYFGPHSNVRGSLGEGQLTDKIEDAIQLGAERIVAVVSPGSVAGVNGTVTAGSGNSGDAVFAAAGTPKSK